LGPKEVSKRVKKDRTSTADDEPNQKRQLHNQEGRISRPRIKSSAVILWRTRIDNKDSGSLSPYNSEPSRQDSLPSLRTEGSKGHRLADRTRHSRKMPDLDSMICRDLRMEIRHPLGKWRSKFLSVAIMLRNQPNFENNQVRTSSRNKFTVVYAYLLTMLAWGLGLADRRS
jgi:hypothetical protein